MSDYSLTQLMPVDSDLAPIPHAVSEWQVVGYWWVDTDKRHDHVNHLWTDGEYVPVGCAVVAVHPQDAAFPHPEGTMSASEYVARTLAMASHPSAVDAPESPRESWCTWYGCMTVAAPMRCVFCGDFHPRGIPSPDVRAYA